MQYSKCFGWLSDQFVNGLGYIKVMIAISDIPEVENEYSAENVC